MLKAIALPYVVEQNCPSVPLGVVELSDDVDLRKDQMLDLFLQTFEIDPDELDGEIEFVMKRSPSRGDFGIHYNAEIFLYFHIVEQE